MTNQELDARNDEIIMRIRKNLEILMEVNGIQRSKFCDYIEKHNLVTLHRSTFTKFMNMQRDSISFAFLESCCKCFKLSMDNLLSDDFDPDENYEKPQIKDADKHKLHSNKSKLFPHVRNDIFIENPNSPILEKYLQKYHCYYFSTVSSENKSDNVIDSILTGTLDIKGDHLQCKAVLSIDTKTKNAEGQSNYKLYEGRVIACPSIQSVYCILANEKGDVCFIIFRYSYLLYEYQKCRIAEVLTTSSTADRRVPTVHRMLLSSKEINEEHLKVLAPHLCLNYSEISIDEKGLLSLEEVSEEYSNIVHRIYECDADLVYHVKEKDILRMAEEYLIKDERNLFITQLRAKAHSYRYNKVSKTVDDTVTSLLKQLGY